MPDKGIFLFALAWVVLAIGLLASVGLGFGAGQLGKAKAAARSNPRIVLHPGKSIRGVLYSMEHAPITATVCMLTPGWVAALLALLALVRSRGAHGKKTLVASVMLTLVLWGQWHYLLSGYS